jgi:hypothetical protein
MLKALTEYIRAWNHNMVPRRHKPLTAELQEAMGIAPALLGRGVIANTNRRRIRDCPWGGHVVVTDWRGGFIIETFGLRAGCWTDPS